MRQPAGRARASDTAHPALQLWVARLAFSVAVVSCVSLAAQAQAPPASVAAVHRAEPSGEAVTLTFFNRPIVVLRARVLGRSPSERAAAAEKALDELAHEGITAPVTAQPFEGGALISVGTRGVIALASPDVDEQLGETLQAATAQTVAALQQTLIEAVQARTPGAVLRSILLALIGIGVGLFLLLVLVRVRRVVAGKLVSVAEQKMARTGLASMEILRASRLSDFERGLVTTLAVAIELVVMYVTLTFALRQFPYSRPWGDSMRGFLLTTVQNLGLGVVNAMPGLFTVALIALIARFVVRLIGLWFTAVERGSIKVGWIYPETAQPTRRLLTTLVWLFAIVVAYPYLPGSQTDAFKGVSVFVGLMVTLGSSGLVNHVMSGFMITYSRGMRVGDFVRVGDVEGTVAHLGVLGVKVKTLMHEEVTIPNAVVVAQTMIDYSRPAEAASGVFTPTSVTIGYDAPWRQVQSLMLMAAERTPGIRRQPEPHVLQMGLEDFYVKYTLFVCLEHQEQRRETLHALHANIQDLFNEYGVQIMSPNYVLDPAAPKVVAKKDWFAAPARPDAPQGGP